MKKLLGAIRRADQDFGMIQDGDRVAVGVSGGKDSLALLEGLARYREFGVKRFEVVALTVTMGLGECDLEGIGGMCQRLGVRLEVVETQIGRIVFEERREKNPCALCSKMRRGALAGACGKLGCGKLALGHHRDDAVETLLMSVLYEGRLHTFEPVTYLEKTGIVQIRPMIYLSEKEIIHVARKFNLPVMKSPCPADGKTRREEAKRILDELCRTHPDAREKILSSLLPFWVGSADGQLLPRA